MAFRLPFCESFQFPTSFMVKNKLFYSTLLNFGMAKIIKCTVLFYGETAL